MSHHLPSHHLTSPYRNMKKIQNPSAPSAFQALREMWALAAPAPLAPCGDGVAEAVLKLAHPPPQRPHLPRWVPTPAPLRRGDALAAVIPVKNEDTAGDAHDSTETSRVWLQHNCRLIELKNMANTDVCGPDEEWIADVGGGGSEREGRVRRPHWGPVGRASRAQPAPWTHEAGTSRWSRWNGCTRKISKTHRATATATPHTFQFFSYLPPGKLSPDNFGGAGLRDTPPLLKTSRGVTTSRGGVSKSRGTNNIADRFSGPHGTAHRKGYP